MAGLQFNKIVVDKKLNYMVIGKYVVKQLSP